MIILIESIESAMTATEEGEVYRSKRPIDYTFQMTNVDRSNMYMMQNRLKLQQLVSILPGT